MTEIVETRKVHCDHRGKEVAVAITPASSRDGHAMLQDHEEVVCLDFGEKCDGEICPLSRFRPVVMGVRLARSDLREEWTTVRAQCEGCGQVSDLKVLDKEHAFCVLCRTTNTWMVLEFDDQGRAVVAGRKEG